MLGSRRSRLFCSLALFLAFWVPCLSLGANAASVPENLINPDLRTWDWYEGTLSLPQYSAVLLLDGSKEYTGHDIYRMTFSGTQIDDSGPYFCIGDLYTDVELVAGKSYTFEFYLPDYRDLNLWISKGENADSGYYGTSNDDRIKKYTYAKYDDDWNLVNTLDVYVGVFFGDPDDDDFQGINDTDIGYFLINFDTFDELAGKTNRLSFVCPDYKGEPHFVIAFIGLHGSTEIHISDLAFYCNDQTAAELKGIKGILHSLYWDLFGGVCDEEDCPHSSEDNPHEDLLSRLFVPDESYITDWKDKLDKLLADHLGIVYDAVDFMGDMIATVRDVLDNPSGDIIFPGIDFVLPNGQHVHLWDDMVVDFSFLESGFFKVFYGMYKLMLNVICIFALTKYAISLWDKTMSN